MRKSLLVTCVLGSGLAIIGTTSRMIAKNSPRDFGTFIQDQLGDHSEQLFGIGHPLEESALGPYDGPDNVWICRNRQTATRRQS